MSKTKSKNLSKCLLAVLAVLLFTTVNGYAQKNDTKAVQKEAKTTVKPQVVGETATATSEAVQIQEKPLGKRSVYDERWKKDGFFAEYTPEKEMLQYRSRTSKTFDNENGTRTAFFMGPMHYKDETGVW